MSAFWGARAVGFAILTAACAISLALSWPGQLSYDSVVQLHDGRTGHYNAWHPPVMAWMLGVADSLVRGAGLFVLLDTLLFFGSIASLLWVARRPSWSTVGLAIVYAALPQVLLYQGIVWKDVLFADATIAGFVLIAHLAAGRCDAVKRWLLLCGAVLCLALATLARQNGVVVVPFATVAILFAGRLNGQRWTPAVALSVGATAALAGIVILASLALATRTVGAAQPAGQIRLLQLYDLIGEVKSDPALRLETLDRSDRALSSLIRTDGVRLYTPVRNDTLFASARLQQTLADAKPEWLSQQWNSVLLAHPGVYLRTRAQVFFWVLATPQLEQCMPYFTGVTGPPAVLRELKLRARYRSQDAALATYAALFVRTPLFSHILYAVLLLGALAYLLWRRRAGDIAIACLLGAAFAYAASFFVISIACDYRYLVVVDLSALAALFYCAAGSGRAAGGNARFTRS